ncbi:MAG TPA: methyl-accepting chemotaxis protein [Telluria sp.]|jgi:methyl-accepting chemotaxis protein
MIHPSFRNASIKTKLMLSMAACLLVFLVVSVSLSVTLSSRGLRARVVDEELPAQIGQIRNDILRQIAVPLTASLAIADNTYLHAWENAGLPEDGVPAWLSYANAIKQKDKAETVFWVSGATGKYYTDKGYSLTMTKSDPGNVWFYAFLDSGKPYSMRIGQNMGHTGVTLYINTRFDAAPDKAGVAGLGLSVDAMADSVRAYKVGQSGSVYLVHDDGNIVVHRDAKLADGEHNIKDLPGFSPELAKQLLGKAAYAHASYDAPDGKRLVASSFVPELNLYVIAEVPEAEALGGIARASTLAALVAALVGGGLGLCVIWMVARAIAAPVARAAALLGEIADGKGDLTRRMPVESRDEVGALAEAFNRFVSSLNHTMSEVRGSTVAIASASGEIAAGNGDLSTRTEQQSANLEQTVATIAQLTATVKQNADHARTANQLVMEARGQAEKGGEVVGEVVATMGSISDSSRRIADIIGVIDGIAFQTNILALNAAVEAARAGEQGRGFAVVASEVRSLAQRSASAAKEIKDLISDSVGKVQAGSRLVDAAGMTMAEVVDSVRRVADLMAEIAAASGEQSDSIARVNGSIEAMDDSTRQNAALVEQAAAAAMALQDQSARLAQVVAAFRLAEDAR